MAQPEVLKNNTNCAYEIIKTLSIETEKNKTL